MHDSSLEFPRAARRRVALHTIGCKLNYAETSTIARDFAGRGFDVVEFGTAADVIVINSCTVTAAADRECRQMVRRALRANPKVFVVVTGCYAQMRPEEIASIDGVDMVLGTAEKQRVPELVGFCEKQDVPQVIVSELTTGNTFGVAHSAEGDARTRAFLKVQDGCDYSCSFCTIPMARGASRSQPIADALKQARGLVSAGFQEIVLTGVNVGDFGRRRGESFNDLLRALHNVDGLRRLRISSIEPNLLEDRTIAMAAASDRLLPHFHLPLQSGSDGVLSRMRRRYRSEQFGERVERIVSEIPHAAIGVDVIVGFPGETDQEFQETVDVIHALPIAYLHVFTYSERRDTPAADAGHPVPTSERRRRTSVLRVLSERKRALFAEGLRGTVRPVLFEKAQRGDRLHGLTDNYVRVSTAYDERLANRIVNVVIGAFDGEACEGGYIPALAKGASPRAT